MLTFFWIERCGTCDSTALLIIRKQHWQGQGLILLDLCGTINEVEEFTQRGDLWEPCQGMVGQASWLKK